MLYLTIVLALGLGTAFGSKICQFLLMLIQMVMAGIYTAMGVLIFLLKTLAFYNGRENLYSSYSNGFHYLFLGIGVGCLAYVLLEDFIIRGSSPS